MKIKRWPTVLLSLTLALCLTACSGGGESQNGNGTPDEIEEGADGTVSMSANFSDESGAGLEKATVRVTTSDGEQDFTIVTDGDVAIPGLPLPGHITLQVISEDGESLGSVDLDLSKGDAAELTAQEDGSYAVTVSGSSVHPNFTVANDGTVTCELAA